MSVTSLMMNNLKMRARTRIMKVPKKIKKIMSLITMKDYQSQITRVKKRSETLTLGLENSQIN